MQAPARGCQTAQVAPHLHAPATLAHLLAHSVARAPDRTALVFGGRETSYRELGLRVAALARELRQRVPRGGIVAAALANSPECVVTAFAAFAAGVRYAPLNPFYGRSELATLFRAQAPDLIVHNRDSAAAARALAEDTGGAALLELDATAPFEDDGGDAAGAILSVCPDLSPDEPALLIFTGGTTGLSKAVEHSHAGMVFSVRAHCTGWELRYDVERILDVAPLFHIWGLGFSMLAPLYLASTLILLPRYQPEQVLQQLQRQRATVFAGGPAPIYAGLLASPEFASTDLGHLTLALTGGSPCPQPLREAWMQKVGTPLLEGWGMSEGAPLVYNWRSRPQRPSSVGHPAPGIELRLVDVADPSRPVPVGEPGEVCVRGPQVMRGYRLQENPAETGLDADGWLHSGDVGYLDADGYLYLVDRMKEMILVGGYNVYPRQVEDHIRQYPDVADVAVVGIPDPYLGENPYAFVVARRGGSVDVDALLAWCQETLVKYKRPVGIQVLDELPRTGANKLDKRRLREILKATTSG